MKKYELHIIKEIVVIILLFGMIIIRFLPIGEDNTIIKSIGYIGVLISLYDLYIDAGRLYSSYDKFHVIRGWAYSIFILLSIFLLFILTNVILIDAVWSDIFTLFALLVSLPEKLYLFWIGKYVTGGK